MNAAYFKKESLRNKIIGKTSKQPIQWENVGNDTGVKIVDVDNDKVTFLELEEHATKRRMGVTRISAEIFESLKKNPLQSTAFRQQSVFEPVRLSRRDDNLVSPKREAASPVAGTETVDLGNTGSAPAVTTPPANAPQSAKQRLFNPRKAKNSAVNEQAKPATIEPKTT